MENKTTMDNKDFKKIEIKENHTIEYLKRLKETIYKNEKVVFIMPSGKEHKYEW